MESACLSILFTCSDIHTFYSIARYSAWAEVRDDSNLDIDWLLAGYHGNSKKDITVLTKGHGGLEACANVLPNGIPVFGGVRLSNGKFVHFFYADEDTSVMQRGRASMHKNGTFLSSLLRIES